MGINMGRMPSSGMLRRVHQVTNDVSGKPIASIIRLTRIGEPHGVTSQETAFFMVTALKTSNLT
jgi:hypothetical protein